MENVQRGMVRKTINRNIKEKIDAWARTLTFNDAAIAELCKDGGLASQDAARDIVKNNVIVTGGAIASMLLGEMPNDFDVYFKTKKVARLVAQYYVSQLTEKMGDNSRVHEAEVRDTDDGVRVFIKSAGIASADGKEIADYAYWEGDPTGDSTEAYVQKVMDKEISAQEGSYQCVYMSSNAITLSDDIQIVLRFTGPAETIHENFDFVHATCYWTAETGLVLNADAMESLLTRRLVYVGSKFPICSLFRIRKFLKRGFTISASDVFKIAWDVNKLDLEDVNVLEDQLMGVDQAYFMEVIGILRKENAWSKDKPLDRTYLFGIIDRVFEEEINNPIEE